jgi:hypothetical protein
MVGFASKAAACREALQHLNVMLNFMKIEDFVQVTMRMMDVWVHDYTTRLSGDRLTVG